MRTVLLLLAFCLAQCPQLTLAAENDQVSTNVLAPLALKFSVATGNGLWNVSVDGKTAVLESDFSVKPAPMEKEGVRFETTEEKTFLTIGPSQTPMVILVEGFPDWSVTVPTNNRCSFRINRSQRLIDLTTPMGNKTNVTVNFPDGGRAEMWPVSFARYDVMDDTSYYFSGQGRVEATAADGVKKLLSPMGYPMVGGPLSERTDEKERKRLLRIIPPVAFSISGEIRQRLAISTDSGTITLSENQSAVLEMQNGALVSFTHDAPNGLLRWHVRKGYVHFNIPEIRCWRAMALTDQQGTIQWADHAVDVHNQTDMATHPPNRFVIAALSHSMTGSVGPGNILQYVQLEECIRFSAGGIGEEVALQNTRTGEVTPLADANILVQQGTSGGGVIGTPDTFVTQGAGGTIIVQSGGKGTSLTPGSERTVVGPNGQDLLIAVSPEGTVRITALTGDQTFGVGPLGDWTFTVREGDTFIFEPTGRRDVFVVRAGEGNEQPLEVFSPEGFRPSLPGDTSLTFVTGDSQTTVERGDQVLVFYDRGEGVGELPFGVAEVSPHSMDGRGTPQPFGRLVDQSDPTQLIPPTIIQPAASVVGLIED